MRTRWHRWWLLGLVASACVLNPQPDIPSSSGPSVPNTGADPGAAGGTGNSAAGRGAVDTPSGVGGSRPDVDVSEGGEGGEGGDRGENAAGEGGAAGDQLAPGPAK